MTSDLEPPPMHLVLTGAAGAVGSHTLKYLLAKNYTVTAIDIVPLPKPLLQSLDEASAARLSTHVADLTDLNAFESILQSAKKPIGGVIHLGGIPHPIGNDPRVVYNTNVVSNYNILQTCVKLGIHRVVQASSVNAYGLSFTPPGHKIFEELPMTEESPVVPEDPYATSKICCEIQASAMCRYYPDLRVASLRFHMCRDTYKSASADARAPSLWGWVSLDACASAALLGVTSEGWSGHEIFNLASNDICWEGGTDPESRFNGEHLDSLTLLEAAWKGRYLKLDRAWWNGRPRRGFWDCSKAEKLLGWEHDDNV